MSKKGSVNTQKKSKRRLKRSVRRSLAAVLMITAIGVAAIPVPENFAEEEDPGTTPGVTTPESIPEPDAYAYSVDLDDKNSGADKGYQNNITNPKDVDGSDKKTYVTYTVLEGGSGYPRLIWQFEYFHGAEGANDYNLISDYNDKYIRDTIEIEASIITDYVRVELDDYQNWYGSVTGNNVGHNGDSYKCTEPGIPVRDAKFFQDYFADDYDVFVGAWAAYTADPENVTKPNALEATAGELSDEQKLKYYCDNERANIGGGRSISLEGYTLVQVIDESNPNIDYGDNTKDSYVYIPRKDNIEEGAEDKNIDSKGYLSAGQATINGIGDYVFKGVRSVTSLVTSDAYPLRYIGVSAFEDSYIQNINITNVANISDRAFKDCTNLTSITMGQNNSLIGTEAFYNTRIRELTFANGISTIKPGAFAECTAMEKVDFSKVEKALDIDKYAFYNTTSLNSVIFNKSGAETTQEEFDRPGADASATVNVNRIGDGAFAVRPTSMSLTTFTFPASLTRQISANNSDGIGDCILAGRSGLQYVTMPSMFGSTRRAVVPDNIFYYCFNLQCVKFPDNGDYSCGFADYESKKLFASVNTEGFYVKGPKVASGGDFASPRRATWTAETAVSKVVPYLYVDGGKNYYEVSNGTYLMCIDDAGYLTSCTLLEGATLEDTELVIPSEVGNTKVVGIAEGCFSDKDLNDQITELTISDNSISEIADGVFSNWAKLEKVYIGNSVNAIGNEAFMNCSELYDVTFSTPADYSTFTIGRDAFLTNGTQLTFHGDIISGYAPFDWAMDENNIINTDQVIDKNDTKAGIRVCYKSLAPTYLTVMYNPITELVTLLDYPKYDQISSLLKAAHSDEIADAGCASYEEWMVQNYYIQFSGADNDEKRRAFAQAWAGNEDPAALYSSDLYGPWVNPTFCGLGSGYGDDRTWEDYLKVADGENSGKNALLDWLFEPIVAYAVNNPTPYYTTYKYDIAQNRDAGDMYRYSTPEESSLLFAVEYITVPDAVESIDVYGYYKNLTKDGEEYPSAYNTLNVNTYLTENRKDTSANLDSRTQRMYFGPRVGREDDDIFPGLFSGYYDDALDGEVLRGNDRIRGVTINGVAYLPNNHAFDSCEKLQAVSIGTKCSNIGVVPFRGCYNLINVNFNDNPKYFADNGIIYSRNSVSSGGNTGSTDDGEDNTDDSEDNTDDSNTGGTTGVYTIEECLYARGNGVGSVSIPDANYADDIESVYVGNVSAIKDGAFEDCVNITSVNLGNATTLEKIPKNCFKNCEALDIILLPESVNYIDEGAFAYDNVLSQLKIPGKEVFISAQAFVADNSKRTTRVYTYPDSSAKRYVDKYGLDYKLEYEKLEAKWTVIFLDYDGIQIGETLSVEDGGFIPTAKVPDPPEKEDWVFEKWISPNQVEITSQIFSDTVFIAKGYSVNGMIDGVHYKVDFIDQLDGSLIWSALALPGEAVMTPQPPTHEGYTFVQWSSDEYLNVQSNLTILAMYSGSGTGDGTGGDGNGGNGNGDGTGGNGNGSGGTNTPTPLNPTSTTSSSASAGKYTVTVINGSGSGSYEVGTTVIISANTPASGKVFSKWTTDSDAVKFASVSMTATTFVMPASNVTVTANYIDGSASNTVSGSVNNRPTGSNTGTNGTGSTRVDITKPGISNKDLATATVNGSTDNFVVKISETNEATQAVINALTNKYGNLDSILYYAMDISLYDSTGTVKIANTQGLSVDITIPIPDALTVFGGNNMAGAVIGNNQLEDLSERFTTINGVPCISFTATHFSPYTIYVDTQNLSEGMLDITPKTGDPIHPKWFLSLGLACLSVILFMKKDKKPVVVKAA